MIIMETEKVGWVPVPLLIVSELRKPRKKGRTAVTYFSVGFAANVALHTSAGLAKLILLLGIFMSMLQA